MLTGHTSSTSDELERLRQRYEKLCDLMTRTAETDPAAAERVLSELQGVSEKLLILETTGPTNVPTSPAADAGEGAEAPETSAPIEPAPASAAAAPLPAAPPPLAASPPDPAPAPPPADIPPQSFRIDEPAPPAGGATPRIVAFRVTSTATPRTAVRQAAAEIAAPVAETAPAPDSPKAAPAAPPPASGPAEPASPGRPVEDPTRFSAAIRQWLERQRSATDPKPAESQAGRRSAKRGEASPHGAASAVAAPLAAPAPPPPDELGRIAAAIEQQALQIERILEMCQNHQAALERLEAQITARFAAAPSLPAAEPGPELSELRGAVEEQRQRVTALAKTIHNLAQWLAAQRTRPER